MGDFILLAMLFCHIVDDYYLQGILASMKQKKWWQENAPDKLYEYDYLTALLMHGFSWAFMIMLPIAIACGLEISFWFAIVFFLNAVVHCYIDNLKANKRKINLCQDQAAHLFQIVITFWLFTWGAI